jgi:16S rRNA (uracil1498-N3)-methyltransferase
MPPVGFGGSAPSGEPPPRFLVAPDDVRQGSVHLGGEEGHHARNVFRLRPGDPFVAIDGQGAEYEAVVQIQTPDGLIGKITHTTRRTREPLARLTLAQAVVKAPKLSAVVAFGTALGVTEFVFFESARTQQRIVDETELRHLNAVAAATVKQSLRATLPAIRGPLKYQEVIREAAGFNRAFLCTADPAAAPLATALAARAKLPNRILIVVGPEGGFDDDEVAEARALGLKTFDLGPRRLRAELAGPTACALALFAMGDMGPTPSG